MERIEGIIFDLDGTLYSLAFPQLWMTLALLKDLKILRHLSASRSSLRGKSFSDGPALREAVFEELGKRARVGKTRAQKWYEERFLQGFVKMLEAHAKVRPGLNSLLASLRSRGVKLGVISDYGCVAERLRAIGADDEAFDDLLAAEDFGTLKPSAVPFLALAKEWDVAPSSVVIVGDREDLDENSAREAGMGFLGISDGMFANRSGDRYSCWDQVAQELENRTTLVNSQCVG